MKTLLSLVILVVVSGLGSGCGHRGTVRVDQPTLVPYQAPDISEITGIDEDDGGNSGDSGSGSAGSGQPKSE